VEKFQIGDPFMVAFNKERYPYESMDGHVYKRTNEKSFFYYGLDMDWENPNGTAMVEAAWSLMQMANNMLDDMARSSANAGIPRLHIKITQPDKLDDEDDSDYIGRANAYFDSYVQKFADIGPDDNFYSWDDLSIGVAGGQPGATGVVWRMNRGIFDEEIIAGFHLFPWIVGKSTQTTKNWVRSQFDLIMAEAEALQKVGSRFIEWIGNIELRLNGIVNVKLKHYFEPVRDPARKDMAIAERFEIANVDEKIQKRFISPDDGARELGYDKCYDSEHFPYRKSDEDTKDGPNHKDDKADEILEGIEEIRERMDNQTFAEDSENAGDYSKTNRRG